jgi:protein-disulfide isomerase
MEEKQSSYLIPASIVVAGALIALAVFFTSGTPVGERPDSRKDQGADSFGNSLSPAAKNVRKPDSKDHTLGNPDAPVKIIEFSDLECPFCKRYHPTLKQAMQEYGKDGRISWIYRHFPLDSIHSKARKEAEASECAAELGGNEKFWAYVDRLFELTPSNNNLDPSLLPKIAEDVGLDKAKFESCLASGRHASRVQADYEDAINSGGDGTPYTVILTKNGDVFPFSGALPYNQVKSVIEKALASLK